MTAADRQRLRLAVDARRRQLVRLPPQPETIRNTETKRRRREAGLIVVTVHGRNGYGNGCRCDACYAGNRAYNRAHSKARVRA